VKKFFSTLIKTLVLTTLCFGICLSVCSITPPAWALTSIKISNLSYKPCEGKSNMVLGGGVMAANCYMVHGTATNPTGKTVLNADVFGRIYDANNNDVMPERARLGSIAEVPPGKSEFEIMISVPAMQPEPLQLKQFKASGFTGKVRRF
jgi:hypothetical protein